MTCWDHCSWVDLEEGDDTDCIRNIYDGTKDTARLWFEVIDIRYSPNEDSEVDIYVKIFETPTGGAEEIVYESTDTVIYGYGKVYYKYNHWFVDFNDIETDGSEVTMRISHKPLCPGCTCGYLCDCEDTVTVGNDTYTRAPVMDGSILYEQCQVDLISIAGNENSCYAHVRIWDMYGGGGQTHYDQYLVINKNDYVSCTDSDLEYDWRVYVNDISFGMVDFQLCYTFEDSGEGNGSGGIGGVVYGQYFDTTGWGYSGGCFVQGGMENPLSHGGECTVPSEVRMRLYAWNTDYNTTIAGPLLGQDTLIVPIEEMIIGWYGWLNIPFIWDYDAPPGEYMWILEVLEGSHDGSFFLINTGGVDGDKWTGYINGAPNRSYISRIIGLETAQNYQKVTSTNDTFGNQLFIPQGGHPKIYVNNNTDVYNNATTSKAPYNGVSRGNGSITDIENPSFETGDFTGWTHGTSPGSSGNTITVDNGWSTHGDYSIKYSFSVYDDGVPWCHQPMTFTNISDRWVLLWDMYVFGGVDIYNLSISMGTIVYDEPIQNGTFINKAAAIPRTASNYLHISVRPEYTYENDPKTVYLDNFRLHENSVIPTLKGRVVGGASDVIVI